MKDAEEKCEIQAVYEALRESHIDFSHWLLEMVCCAITSDREEEGAIGPVGPSPELARDLWLDWN